MYWHDIFVMQHERKGRARAEIQMLTPLVHHIPRHTHAHAHTRKAQGHTRTRYCLAGTFLNNVPLLDVRTINCFPSITCKDSFSYKDNFCRKTFPSIYTGFVDRNANVPKTYINVIICFRSLHKHSHGKEFHDYGSK